MARGCQCNGQLHSSHLLQACLPRSLQVRQEIVDWRKPSFTGGRATLLQRRPSSWPMFRSGILNFVVTSLQDSVFQLFQRVENKHGWMLVVPYFVLLNFHFSITWCKVTVLPKVSHALAYVTASKSGVSEPEIEDFISLDDKVEIAIDQIRECLGFGRHLPIPSSANEENPTSSVDQGMKSIYGVPNFFLWIRPF